MYLITFRKFKKTCLFRYDWIKRKPICENPYSKNGVCAEKNCPVLGGCVKVKKSKFHAKMLTKYWIEVKK